MGYYWFNTQDILQKAKERYSKEKAAEYYLKSKEAIKKKSREHYKNLSQEEKDKIKEYQRKKYIKTWFIIKKKRCKINNFCSFLSIKRMSEKHENLTILGLIRKNFINLSNQLTWCQ